MAKFARRLIALIGLAALLAGCGNDNPTKPTGCGDPVEGTICVEPVTSADWVRGDRDAPISVITYMDLECPFCKAFYPTLESLRREYPGTINLVFRHFPLTALWSKSVKEAEASECAGELGGNDKFWAFTDRVFTITPSRNGLDPAELPKIAEDIGINRKQFEECLDSGKHTQKIQDAINQAYAAGAMGTPYTVIVSGKKQRTIGGAVLLGDLRRTLEPFLKN